MPPRILGFEVALPEFVTALLTKRVTWEVPQFSRKLHIEFMRDVCWACEKDVQQVCGMNSDDEHWWFRPLTVASLSQTLEGVHQVVQAEELRSIGLNDVGTQQVINGNRTKWPYCNLCRHCRAPQNNFHVTEKLAAAFRQLDSQGEAPPASPEKATLGIALLVRVERGSPRWVYKAEVPAG